MGDDPDSPDRQAAAAEAAYRERAEANATRLAAVEAHGVRIDDNVRTQIVLGLLLDEVVGPNGSAARFDFARHVEEAFAELLTDVERQVEDAVQAARERAAAERLIVPGRPNGHGRR